MLILRKNLALKSTKERSYRGYCISDSKALSKVVSIFNQHKKDIYKIYTDCPYLSAKYIKSTTRFLDEFYITINNPKRLAAVISRPCSRGYTIVKGLHED
jgi:hypothetical protein